MSNNPLIKKLHIKPGQSIAIIHPPLGEKQALSSLSNYIDLSEKLNRTFDLIHLFVRSTKELEHRAPKTIHALKPKSIFGISYPKLSSENKTDINREKCWEIMRKFGYRAVSQVSIDDVWSALRFKPIDKVIGKNAKIPLVDTIKRTVTIPKDLKTVFSKNKKAETFFKSLSFTHKKEYVLWMETAKKEKTRAVRVVKTVEMLLKGMKNS